MGSFDVRLYDKATPKTVDNMLGYINRGEYENSLIHRVSGTPPVLQGGGWTYDGSAQEEPQNYPLIPQYDPVVNEPGISNLYGTISLAKPNTNPDSATNNWFINGANNVVLDSPASAPDRLSFPFTVFGRVLGDGMNLVTSIASLPRFPFMGAWGEAPMRNYTAQEFNDLVPVEGDNLVIVNSIEVIQIAPPSALLLGDYDRSGKVGKADYEIWNATLGSTTDLRADGNGDGKISAADYNVWFDHLNAVVAYSGDYNFDGIVDDEDYDVWLADFGSTTKAEADGNGDGIVSAADYAIWRDNLGASSPFGSGSGSSASNIGSPSPWSVPEPSSVLMLGFLSLGWSGGRHLRRRASNN